MGSNIKETKEYYMIYDKVVDDEVCFSDYLMKCSDSVGIKKMNKRIQESIREYELSYRCGLLNESEKEYVDIREKLHFLNKSM